MSSAQRRPCQIEISVANQELLVQEGSRVVARYPISTAARGTGSQEGSYRTPLGQFAISEMFGDEAEHGTIFKARQAVGRWIEPSRPTGLLSRFWTDLQALFVQGPDEDLVLTRILWLEGLDPENANTKERYIYIHGTNQERGIGRPASHGCVRMRNTDVVDLYRRASVGTRVSIG